MRPEDGLGVAIYLKLETPDRKERNHGWPRMNTDAAARESEADGAATDRAFAITLASPDRQALTAAQGSRRLPLVGPGPSTTSLRAPAPHRPKSSRAQCRRPG